MNESKYDAGLGSKANVIEKMSVLRSFRRGLKEVVKDVRKKALE